MDRLSYRLLIEYSDGTFRVYEDTADSLALYRAMRGERVTWTRGRALPVGAGTSLNEVSPEVSLSTPVDRAFGPGGVRSRLTELGFSMRGR